MTDMKSRGVTRRRVVAGPLGAAMAIAVGLGLVWALVAVWSNEAFS